MVDIYQLDGYNLNRTYLVGIVAGLGNKQVFWRKKENHGRCKSR